MDGAGECGYDYYEGVTGDGAKKTVKKGNFADDLMEGEISYTSVNGDGESTSWTMTVENGVIVPDARWISDTSDDGTPVFRLMADTDDVHAYVVEADAMEEVRWKNMIEWGESRKRREGRCSESGNAGTSQCDHGRRAGNLKRAHRD